MKAKAKPGERLPYLLQKLKAPRVLERLEQTGTKEDPEMVDNLGVLGIALEWGMDDK